jgi:hypothetical protein
MAQPWPRIDVGYHVFVRGSNEEFGAVREVYPRGRPEIVIYVENAGEFIVPLWQVSAVEEEKVMLDAGRLDERLREAIRQAHDNEDWPS